MNTERDLLYGVLALQADLINTEQFVDACTAWSAQRNGSLESLLLEWGYLAPTDHRSVEYLMHRRLAKHAGDVHASLATISDDRWRYALASLNDPYVQQVISSVPLSPAVDREQANLSIHELDLGAAGRSTKVNKLPGAQAARLNRVTLAFTVFVVVFAAVSATYLLTRERHRIQDLQTELSQAHSQLAEERVRSGRFAGESMTEHMRAEAEHARAEQERVQAHSLRGEIEKVKAENERLRTVAREAVGQANPVAKKPTEATTPATPNGDRLAALLTAVEQLERQLQSNTANPEPQRELAEACKKLADEHVRLGQLDKAEPHYQRALVLSEKLAKEHESKPIYRAGAAACRMSLGLLFRDQGRLEPAIAELKEAVAGFEQLTGPPHEVAEHRGALGQALQQLAATEFLAGRMKDAETSSRRALAALEKATDSTANRARLAAVHELLGRILFRTQRLVEAEAAHRRALDLRELLVRHGENQDHLRALASSHQQLATVYQATGRLAQAEASAQRAIVIRQNLVRDLPHSLDARRDLALSQRTLGGIHQASERFVQAEAVYRSAITALEEFAKGAEGAGVVDDLGAAFFDLAGLHALQAVSGTREQRERHSTKAVDALERARNLGFFASAPNRDRLGRETQFDSLRQRDDFRKLIDSLTKPSTANR